MEYCPVNSFKDVTPSLVYNLMGRIVKKSGKKGSAISLQKFLVVYYTKRLQKKFCKAFTGPINGNPNPDFKNNVDQN